jgi:uncharacterized protein YbjT (DUF2867 family)
VTLLLAVTGVTGTQGSAVAREMLRRGFRVRGLSRRPHGKAARRLASGGTEIVPGDMSDSSALDALLRGASAVYCVTDFFRNGVDRAATQGKLVADAAQRAGVSHFVFASIASADQGTGLHKFESKAEVERHIRALGLPHTVLRPTLFMQDLTDARYAPPLNWGMISKIVGEHRPLPWIAVEDIALVTAKVLLDPQRYLGKAIPLTGDLLSIAEARDVFTRVTGRRPLSLSLPNWLFGRVAHPALTEMWQWLAQHSWGAPVEQTREHLQEVQSFEAWLRAR